MVKVVIPIIKHIDPKLVLHEMLQKAYPKLDDIQEFCAGCPEVSDGVAIEEILTRPDYNRSDNVPLHIACCQADTIDPHIVEFLIGLCPRSALIQNRFGMNPLHCALLNNRIPQLEIVRLLCEGTDHLVCMQPNKQGMLPIHICLKSPRDFGRGISSVILAENMKEQLSFQDSYGFVPLHQAVANKKTTVDLMEFLLSSCPRSAQAQDASGSLPLHWLLSSFDYPDVLILRLLLMYHPASAMIADKEGQLPLSRYMFRVNKNPQVIQILLQQRQFVLDNPSCLVLLEHNNSIYSQSVASGDVVGSLASITGEGSSSTVGAAGDTLYLADGAAAGGCSPPGSAPGSPSKSRLRKGSEAYSGRSSPSSVHSGHSGAVPERVRRSAAVGHSPGHGPHSSVTSPARGGRKAASGSAGSRRVDSSSPAVGAARNSPLSGRKTPVSAASPVTGRRKSSAAAAISPVTGRRKSSAAAAVSPVTGRRKSSVA